MQRGFRNIPEALAERRGVSSIGDGSCVKTEQIEPGRKSDTGGITSKQTKKKSLAASLPKRRGSETHVIQETTSQRTILPVSQLACRLALVLAESSFFYVC